MGVHCVAEKEEQKERKQIIVLKSVHKTITRLKRMSIRLFYLRKGIRLLYRLAGFPSTEDPGKGSGKALSHSLR